MRKYCGVVLEDGPSGEVSLTLLLILLWDEMTNFNSKLEIC